MEIFFIDYRPGPRWLRGRPTGEQPLAAHAAYLAQLLKAGRLEVAGLFADGSGGVAVVQAQDAGEAEKIVNDDPGVIDGVFIASVRTLEVKFRRG